MNTKEVQACVPVDISDDDIYDAMKDISGYIDITPSDFKEVYVKAYQYAVMRLLRSVVARNVMTRDVAFVKVDTPLQEVADLMARRRISGVPVVDDEARVVGVISERDFLRVMGGGEADSLMGVVSLCLSGRSCLVAPGRAKSAADIMTSPPVTVEEGTPVLEVAAIFTRQRVNRVPVLDSKGRMVGIVSRADVVRASWLQEAS